MSDVLFDKIVKKLVKDTYLAEFAFRKRECCLIKKTASGFEAIELQHWKGFDLNRNKVALVIKPLYLKRFDVLHRWFEKFSFKSLLDQRGNYSIGFDGEMLNKTNEFYFLLDGIDFENDFNIFKKEVIKNADFVFDKYSDIDDLYQYYIEPVLNKGAELPNVGADWVFEYLTLTKLVKVEYYNLVKNLLEAQVNKLNDRGEPNIIEYYPKFDEIVSYLENAVLPGSSPSG